MEISDRRLSKFLYIIEGVGAVFVALFLAAYLGGLPTTAVLHSEPIFRIPLFVFGAVLLELIVGAVIVAVLAKKS
jgi:pyridoxal/pyridoxine/pyridoxamine kinase